MKNHIAILLAAASLMLTGCHSHSHEHGHDHSHEGHNHEAEAPGHSHEEAEEEAGHKHTPGEIVLHDHVAERFGVTFDTVRAGAFHDVVKVSGRVVSGSSDIAVVSSPTAGTVHYAAGAEPGRRFAKGAAVATVSARGISGGDANAAARTALESARRELSRVEALFADKLATQAELNAARAAFERAEAEYSPAASTGRATAPVAGTLTSLVAREGQYVGVGEVIATISRGEGSVLRADLPQRYFDSASSFVDMVADFPGRENFSVVEAGGHRLSTAPAADSNTSGAYIPVYFASQGAGAAPGSAFTAYLIGAPRQGVITVPVSALSEQQGQFFVYQCLDGEHYEKHAVRVGGTDGRRAEILSGLEPGMVIAATGVSAVRLAETSAVAPEGHSHNH